VGATGYAAARPARALLVLAPGAGAGQRHPFMVSVARGLADRGIDVVTFDFPYRRAGRRVPDRAPALEAAFREAVDAARGWRAGDRLFVGGKSMGGRMATHLAAAGLDGLCGVVALGYPLHPPGRPDRPRIAHLPSIAVPVLVVQGERDTFGTPDELAPVIESMRAPVHLHAVAGGDHSLVVRGAPRGEVPADVLDVVRAWVEDAR